MNIYILSRLMAESGRYMPSEPYFAISIVSPEAIDVVLKPDELRVGSLYMKFMDLDDSHDGRYDVITPATAQRIADIVHRYGDSISYVVHCEAGISRSAGVAAAISKYLTGDDSSIFRTHIPNRLVYRTVLEALMCTSVAEQDIPECTIPIDELLGEIF